MTYDRIGDYEFITIGRMPDVPKESLALSARAGVPGVAAWTTGVRGTPFTIRSLEDCADVSAAQIKYRYYVALIGADPQAVTWAEINWDSVGFRFLVLGVRIVQARAIVASDGGINPDSEAILECEWDLLPVVYP